MAKDLIPGRVYRGYIITKGIEKFNGYNQLIYRAERIKKVGYVNSFMAFKMKDLIEIIKAYK